MYAKVADFRISRGPPTVPLTRISCNTFFSSPKIRVRWGPSVLPFQALLFYKMTFYSSPPPSRFEELPPSLCLLMYSAAMQQLAWLFVCTQSLSRYADLPPAPNFTLIDKKFHQGLANPQDAFPQSWYGHGNIENARANTKMARGSAFWLFLQTVSFSSCQRNLIKTFQIDGMIALITKMAMIFS